MTTRKRRQPVVPELDLLSTLPSAGTSSGPAGVSGLVDAGEGLIGPSNTAKRDPEVFADPDKFDVERAARHHIAFGFGTGFPVFGSRYRPTSRVQGRRQRLRDL